MIEPYSSSMGNCYVYISDTNVTEGEKITITITNKRMIVSGFSCWLNFETDILECISITRSERSSGTFGFYDENGLFHEAQVVDSVASTNSDGCFSFGFVSSEEYVFQPGNIACLTFRAKKSGTVRFSLGQDSSGRDGWSGYFGTLGRR